MNEIIILFGGLLLRCLVGLWPHSGKSNPPMFGDYEAQRHWMELTVNIPVTEWYFKDLEYWGLDYPPLTAYHSYGMGLLARKISNNTWTDWNLSRGTETNNHRFFMRLTALFADLAVFFPAIFLFYKEINLRNKEHVISFALFYPGLILIDHGHFQYNCISLGLTIAAVVFIVKKRYPTSAVLFTAALNYKQMSLYHSLPFFVFLLRKCTTQKSFLANIFLFIKLSFAVLLTFLILWSPFLQVSYQVLHRLFPIARGVFEDKVANIWCVINVIWKLKNLEHSFLVKLCLVCTILGALPSLIHLWIKPTLKVFYLSLINVSMSFFLFSFQVHEKSILLPAVAVLLYLPYNRTVCVWFLISSTFSMVHLYQKDKLIIPFLCLYLSYVAFAKVLNYVKYRRIFNISQFISLFLLCLLIGFEPPVNLPDLWPLLISAYSCLQFCLFFVYFNYEQMCCKD